MQSNRVNTDQEGAIESAHIKRDQFRENVKAFFPRDDVNCPY